MLVILIISLVLFVFVKCSDESTINAEIVKCLSNVVSWIHRNVIGFLEFLPSTFCLKHGETIFWQMNVWLRWYATNRLEHLTDKQHKTDYQVNNNDETIFMLHWTNTIIYNIPLQTYAICMLFYELSNAKWVLIQDGYYIAYSINF